MLASNIPPPSLPIPMHAVGGRRVRPRPVNYNERLPVVRMYGGDDDLDPSLEAFLEAQEEEQALMRALEEGASPKPKGKKQVILSCNPLQ